MEIVFKTDPYVAKYGFDIDKYQFLEENKNTPDPKKKRKTKPKTPKKPKKIPGKFEKRGGHSAALFYLILETREQFTCC